MKRFLLAAFKITLFQVLFISVMTGLKFILTDNKIADKIEIPFFGICLRTGVIFFFSLIIMGIIENRGKSFKEWNSEPKKSAIEKFIASFVSWGIAIPIALAYVLFFYIITPTSFLMFISLYAGIVINNCISFFSENQTQQTID